MGLGLPNLPRGLAGVPDFLEENFISEGIHRLPEAVMVKGFELAFLGEFFQRLAFPNGLIAINGGENGWFEDKEPTIDP